MSRKFKNGDKVRFKNSKEVFTVVGFDWGEYRLQSLSGYYTDNVKGGQLEPVEKITPREQLERRLVELQNILKKHKEEYSEVVEKLSWMNTHGLEDFDEVEFKVWKVIQEFNTGGLSELEKTKRIAAIIKSV